ncbi:MULTISPECIES: carbohydrate kinase family protein [Rubrivivax]|uniref:Carbohydrate kinase family protein n=1 Tax=Rubrivivax benzoatilyticus TaxID=316997 RepID=A0ABX0HS16_9BURK|nr:MULTISPECIES: carbohydrate kinase family protein [Rubrivivax]EGJ10997.1 putative sugar kinase transferase protein [Rubrivivax benzoatilyticus JA2 = ATCC BAA-35]MCC9595579.1 carbohydrate kinase family protein [Rubrivivax sp. JA1055]MCC9646914.1 carbohydrate kinase family protein [Rubrivivax sp. JA1029]NHK97844.1 carbohydrate kinase family protein [Rubrivivax benzoatilyticus]NHL23346.1 carbohydrate kinase family protein [Rubrivivax benzoatilyticus]
MPALICGSLAFDTITTYPGRFAEQILPEQMHILNLSFLVPTLRREFGGCAGNIAYTLQALGGEAVVMAALGNDGADYLARMKGWGADTSLVMVDEASYTAQAMIITDVQNNQITAFHPGAMQNAHLAKVPARADLKIGIISPDGREAMGEHAEQMHAAGIPFIFDPGQQLPMFDGPALRRMVEIASWVAVNDYEGRILCERIGTDLAGLSRSNLKGVVVTLGERGCEIWTDGERREVPGVAAAGIVDPTGCGDSFRAALLYGLERGWDLERCAALGNRIGALKIASKGGQNHVVDRAALGL